MEPTLVSLNIGRARAGDGPRSWRSAIWKQPVLVPLDLGKEGLAGDQQANRRVHGGPDKAVCVYSLDHAAWWRETLGAPDWGAGAVGENFTLTGQTEASVCLGDVYQVGTALVQVSQPRSPCRTLARRWGRPDLPKRVVQSGRSGWYLRVLHEGRVETGVPVTLIERPFPEWTIARVNDASYGLVTSIGEDVAGTLADVPVLAAAWRDGMLGR
ncbi:MAG: MOSC domain-containing protein [Vicinamibacteraceae bacterium]